MKKLKYLTIGSFLLSRICIADGIYTSVPAARSPSMPAPPAALEDAGAEKTANNRYGEMLGKMQAAVEEIAQLYGNPTFLQVFTNDPERASELKQRLKAARETDGVRKNMEELKKKSDDLAADIALKHQEAAKLSERLVRQRVALDALAAAVEQAKRTIEDTIK